MPDKIYNIHVPGGAALPGQAGGLGGPRATPCRGPCTAVLVKLIGMAAQELRDGSAGGVEAFDVDAENRHLDGSVDAGTHGWDAQGAAAASLERKVARTPLRRKGSQKRRHNWWT